MRLLVVMTHYPYPPRTGSAILAYRNIKELSSRHEIHLICANERNEQGDLDDYVKRLEFSVRKNRSFPVKLIRYAYFMSRGFPAWMVSSMSDEMSSRVSRMISEQHFDAILLYEITSIQYCPPTSYKKMVVNVEDPPSIKLGRMRKMRIWPRWERAYLAILEKLTSKYERRVFPELARILVLSEADSIDMRAQLGCSNIGYIPYGIDTVPSEKIIPYEQRTDGMIVFSGNMHHPPNVDGALFLLRHILPLVLKRCPNAILWIVGASPDKRICREAEVFRNHVVITGKVAEISEYVRRAMVSVCPIRLRIGVQTKVLEAMSWGTPVVTTTAGNSGICGSSGKELWVEDDPDKFARHVVELLMGENWTQLSGTGLKFAERQFSWERSAVSLEHHLEEVRCIP